MGVRTAHGYPMRQSPARAMDVVARLSGVNFGSVEKVFAALDALYKVRGLSTASLVSIQNCPAVSAFADPKHGLSRARATDAEVQYILNRAHLLPKNVRDILMIDARFGVIDGYKEGATDNKLKPTGTS